MKPSLKLTALDGKTQIEVGDTAYLIAELTPSNGELQSGDINWVPNPTDIVSLEYDDSGEDLPENMVKVVGEKGGTVNVTAIYTNGTDIESSITITVVENGNKEPEEIVNPNEATSAVFTTAQDRRTSVGTALNEGRYFQVTWDPVGKGPEPFELRYDGTGSANVEFKNGRYVNMAYITPTELGHGTLNIVNSKNNEVVDSYKVWFYDSNSEWATSLFVADDDPITVEVGKTIEASQMVMLPEGKGPAPFVPIYKGTGSMSVEIVKDTGSSETYHWKLRCTGIEAGTGVVEIHNTGSDEIAATVDVTIIEAQNLSSVFDESYGLGVSALIKGQSVGLMPAINVNSLNDVKEVRWSTDIGLHINGEAELAGNVTIPSDFNADKVTITAQAVDASGTNIGDPLVVELEIQDASTGVVSIYPASDYYTWVGEQQGISHSLTGFTEEETSEGYIRYECQGALPNSVPASSRLNGHATVNGNDEAIIDYSPMLVGSSEGFVKVSAQNSPDGTTVNGVPGFFIIRVYPK